MKAVGSDVELPLHVQEQMVEDGERPVVARARSREQPQRAAELLSELDRWSERMEEQARRRGTLAVASDTAPSQEETDALRELGYVE